MSWRTSGCRGASRWPRGSGGCARRWLPRRISGTAAPLRQLLARYDELVRRARAQPARAVLTHGEPHPGNTLLTDGGWTLIDWDTALTAPPERDLWSLDPGDGTILDAYADATGVVPRPDLLGLYRLRWDIADIAVDVGRFRRPHAGSADDSESWELLRATLGRACSGAGSAGPLRQADPDIHAG